MRDYPAMTDHTGTVEVFGADADQAVADTVRFAWDALDAWFEEDEQVSVHPRNHVANLVAFLNEHTDITVDGVPQPRPEPMPR